MIHDDKEDQKSNNDENDSNLIRVDEESKVNESKIHKKLAGTEATNSKSPENRSNVDLSEQLTSVDPKMQTVSAVPEVEPICSPPPDSNMATTTVVDVSPTEKKTITRRDRRDTMVARFIIEQEGELGDHSELWQKAHDVLFYDCREEDKGCGGWCTLLGALLSCIIAKYKALLWMLLIFCIAFASDTIQDALEDSLSAAKRQNIHTLPYFGVLLFTFIVKFFNGPGLSKSFITFSLVVIYFSFRDTNPNFEETLLVCGFIDWLMDLAISLHQVVFMAPVMSGSLFFLYTIFVTFVWYFNPWIFCTAIIFQVTYDAPWGVHYILPAVLSIPCLFHIYYKWYRLPTPDYWLAQQLFVDDKYVDDNEETLRTWNKVFQKFQSEKYSALHAYIYVQNGQYNPETGERVKGTDDIMKIWKDDNRCSVLQSFIQVLVLTYTAEFVNIIDSVFLVPYCWYKYYGILVIAICTFLDADRVVTIWYTHQWCDGTGSLEESAVGLLWWKVLKQPIGLIFGCFHAYILHNYCKILNGGSDVEIKEDEANPNSTDENKELTSERTDKSN